MAVKLGRSHCIVHGDVPVFIQRDGTLVHYADDKENGTGNACYGIFIEVPPPSALSEAEWENIFEMEGESYGTESFI